MITTYIGLIRFGFSLIFGVVLTFCFAGAEDTRKNRLALACAGIIFLFSQTFFWWLFGIEITSKLYPLIIHAPMILFLTTYLRRPWLISIVSVLTAYLCCQVPRWVGSIGGAVFTSALAEHICYIAAVFLAYYFFRKYVAATLQHMMGKSIKSAILLGAVPLFYYLFDYITTIYTDLLYQGVGGAVQFMPSVFSIVYFVFIILYYSETQKQANAQRERDMLAAQLQGAHSELVSLRQMQNMAAAYRHDMRHHFGVLQGMAAERSVNKIMEYLSTVQSDIDAITPTRFCENETVNIIISSFTAKAKQAEVLLCVDAKLPNSIALSDTELCSLLSNGLENAIYAAATYPDSERRTVSLKAKVHKSKLLISIENPYTNRVVMKDGLPLSSHQEHDYRTGKAFDDHGYGTGNIARIAEAHGGQAIFSAEDGLFTLRIMLPLPYD